MRTTSTNTTDCRCKNCQALLAKHDRDGLSIRRGDMQTTVTGADFTVAVTCYRCKTLNVLASPRKPTPTPTPALPRATAA
jgi:phage FluMu protein Com